MSDLGHCLPVWILLGARIPDRRTQNPSVTNYSGPIYTLQIIIIVVAVVDAIVTVEVAVSVAGRVVGRPQRRGGQ